MNRIDLVKLVQEARKGSHVKSMTTDNYSWKFDFSEQSVIDTFLASCNISSNIKCPSNEHKYEIGHCNGKMELSSVNYTCSKCNATLTNCDIPIIIDKK